ncbi:hypothetical protein BB561_003566 [Smittium simulii]|uniref:Minichromosome loss protein Mcl1 middle region domain-containing protein n=1 Tax=Smittium simulii TaxID=133385 RepID=A0A2T9YKK7_9FUNG|nr:hypothetical protein BB561_003566 [Smittium simulii]
MSYISPPKFAHTDGYTVVTFSADGSYLITGGSDSLVRIFHTAKEYRHLEAQGKVICSDEEGKVLGFSLNSKSSTEIESNPIGTIYRSSLPVWEIKISSNAMQALISTEEGEVRIVSLLDISELGIINCHPGPINSIDYDSLATKLVTLGNDGTMKLWSTDDLEFQCDKTWDKLAPACQPGEAEEQVKVRFQPNGTLIAVPAKNGGIVLVDSITYELKNTLQSSKSSIFKYVTWSPNGLYVAATQGKDVVIWNVSTLSIVASNSHTEDICTVTWHPSENIVAFSDNLGAIVIWDEVIDLKSTDVVNPHPSEVLNDINKYTHIDSIDSVNNELFEDNEENLNKTKNSNHLNIIDDIGEQDNDSINSYEDKFDDDLNDFIVDEDNIDYSQPKNTNEFKQTDSVIPFQPSATPWLGNKCYLAFSTLGTVISTKVDDSHNSIEIEFFDKSSHRDIRFSDPYKFSIASLSSLGCLFGINSKENYIQLDSKLDNSSNDSSKTSAFILYRAFKGWVNQSDWSFKLNSNEYIQCAALSNNGAAVFTSLGYLRLFSLGGVQVWIESIAKSILACTAKENLLFCVYQNDSVKDHLKHSSSFKNNYSYDWELRKISNGEIVKSGVCPVSQNSKITWIGFSDELLPIVCDSAGILRCLTPRYNKDCFSWIPVFDAKRVSKQRNKQESYWPVGAFENNFIVAIIKGKSLYPSIPKPILSELPMTLPLLHADTNATLEDQNYLLQSILVNSEAQLSLIETTTVANFKNQEEIKLDKLLLGSINIACKTDKLTRAIDLVTMLHSQESLLAAEKIAVFHKNEALAKHIIDIRATFNDQIDADLDQSDNEYEENFAKKLKSERVFNLNNKNKHNSKENISHKALNERYSSGEDGDFREENSVQTGLIDQNKDFTSDKISYNKYPDSLFDDDLKVGESQKTFETEQFNIDSKSISSMATSNANSAFNPFAINAGTFSSITTDDTNNSAFLANSKKLKELKKSKNPFDIKVRKETESTEKGTPGEMNKKDNNIGGRKSSLIFKNKKQTKLELADKEAPKDLANTSNLATLSDE